MKRRHGPLRPRAHGPPILFSITIAVALSICQPLVRADTAPVTVGGPFTLMAPDGTTVTDKTYHGKWLLVFFGYTSCPDICPTTLYEIAAVIEELGPDATKLQPIFITVDPERDTPEVMGKYTGSFHPRIVGLTGSPQQIAEVVREYGAHSAAHKTGAGAEDYAVNHSTYIYIMDRQGKFVRGLDFDTPTGRIVDTLRKIMAQSHE
jgi:protein SCO1/2